jgi:hypothetical protein
MILQFLLCLFSLVHFSDIGDMFYLMGHSRNYIFNNIVAKNVGE